MGGKGIGMMALRGKHLLRLELGGSLFLLAVACALDNEALQVRREVSDADAACITCHADAGSERAAARVHNRAHAVGCVDCHLPHSIGSDGELGPSLERASCASCHPEVVAEFRLPFRHPLGTTVACTSCHTAHGRPARAERMRVREEACLECHTEMRGPFVYDHEGDRLEACLSCHEPHGSSNRRLLTFADTRSLCFSCHELLELSHSQEPGSSFFQCLNCHTEIHGSNWNEALLR